MSKTTIAWTDDSLNPARGCTAVSPGCLNCYAARHATRFSKPGLSFAGLARLKDQGRDANGRKRPKLAVWSGEVTLIPKALHEPLHWSPKHPKRVFVGSVTDMFHEQVPFEYIAALFAVMAATPWVTYQLVTKRPERMAEWFRWAGEHPCKAMRDGAAFYGLGGELDFDKLAAAPWPLPNVHLLTSTENQETFDERVPHLLSCPAVVHGISAEPLLGPIDMGLDRWVRIRETVRADRIPGVSLPGDDLEVSPGVYRAESNALGALSIRTPGGAIGIKPAEFERLALRWVIAGGESGPGSRQCDTAWIRDIHRQCSAANTIPTCAEGRHTAFFLKQLGARAYDERNYIAGARLSLGPDTPAPVRRLKDAAGGDDSEWAHDLQGLRAFPSPAPLTMAQRRHLGIT
jgi:protein gp37